MRSVFWLWVFYGSVNLVIGLAFMNAPHTSAWLNFGLAGFFFVGALCFLKRP